ncbi:MAG TPA: hypothetical protein VK403_03655 [Allosphingosinicella sp.]|nr:hypothetical protein [Allosphingosinicella sp.]
MNLMMVGLLLALAQGPALSADPPFERAASSCGGGSERLSALASFFELRPDQTVAEYQPDFVLTPCIADAVRDRGRLIAVVEGGDRVVQVVRRVAVQKTLKRGGTRYGKVAVLTLKPGKAVPAEHAGSADRVLISGGAGDLLGDRKRATGLLRALGELTAPAGLLGIIDVPDAGGVDVGKLSSIAREAGWSPAGQTSTGRAGLLLLKFRKN